MELGIKLDCPTCEAQFLVREHDGKYTIPWHGRCAELVRYRSDVRGIVAEQRRGAVERLSRMDALRALECRRHAEEIARITAREADERRVVTECDEFLAKK